MQDRLAQEAQAHLEHKQGQGQVMRIAGAVETQVAEVLETMQACRVLLAVVAQEAQAQGQVVAATQVLETVVMEIIKGEIVCQIMKIKII